MLAPSKSKWNRVTQAKNSKFFALLIGIFGFLKNYLLSIKGLYDEDYVK